MSRNSLNKVQKLIENDTSKITHQEIIEGEFVDLDKKPKKEFGENNSLKLLEVYSELLKTSQYFEDEIVMQAENGFIFLDPVLSDFNVEKRQLNNQLKSLEDLQFSDLSMYLLSSSPQSNPELLAKIEDYYRTQVGEKAVELDMIRKNPFKSMRDLAILAKAHGIEGIMTAGIRRSPKAVERELEREKGSLEISR